jgi:hypothetical protein
MKAAHLPRYWPSVHCPRPKPSLPVIDQASPLHFLNGAAERRLVEKVLSRPFGLSQGFRDLVQGGIILIALLLQSGRLIVQNR